MPADAAQPWLRWLIHPGDAEPEVPELLAGTTRRIRRIGRTLKFSDRVTIRTAR